MSLVSLDASLVAIGGSIWFHRLGGRRALNFGRAVDKEYFILALASPVLTGWIADQVAVNFAGDRGKSFVYLVAYPLCGLVCRWLLSEKGSIALGIVGTAAAIHLIASWLLSRRFDDGKFDEKNLEPDFMKFPSSDSGLTTGKIEQHNAEASS